MELKDITKEKVCTLILPYEKNKAKFRTAEDPERQQKSTVKTDRISSDSALLSAYLYRIRQLLLPVTSQA